MTRQQEEQAAGTKIVGARGRKGQQTTAVSWASSRQTPAAACGGRGAAMSSVALLGFGNCELGRGLLRSSQSRLCVCPVTSTRSSQQTARAVKAYLLETSRIYLFSYVPLKPQRALWATKSGRRRPGDPAAVAEDRMEDTDEADVDTIFQDALVSIFGDVAEAHGESGKRFIYHYDDRYPVVFIATPPSYFLRSVAEISLPNSASQTCLPSNRQDREFRGTRYASGLGFGVDVLG
jgi:hypothetical protein